MLTVIAIEQSAWQQFKWCQGMTASRLISPTPRIVAVAEPERWAHSSHIGDMVMKKRSAANKQKSWELSARDVLLPLLSPGENLGIALSGATGWLEGVSLIDLFKALLDAFGGIAGTDLDRTTYIGITDTDLVFAISKDDKKPSRLQRAPLGNVSIVKFKESHTIFLIDVLVIHTGTKRLTLSTLPGLRPVMREFVAELDRRSREADLSGSSRHLEGKLARQTTPLHFRLFRLLEPVPRDITTTLREDGPARASLRASRYSINLFVAALVAVFVFTLGIPFIFTIIFPEGLAEPWPDTLIFILLLPSLLTILLGAITALAAGGLAISSIFKRGDKLFTVIAALLGSMALIFVYYVITVILLTAE